jgi:hypothetical protein
MTGPGGMTTKRDQRRANRRGQLQQQQLLRQRERQSQIRRQRTARIVVTVVGIIVIALLAFILIHAVTSGGAHAVPTRHSQYVTPAQVEVRDGLISDDIRTRQFCGST